VDNLWSLLFATGYLTQSGKVQDGRLPLAIPNKEICQIFVTQIMEWFREVVTRDAPKLDAFCEAFMRADAEKVEEGLNDYLKRTISIRDTNVQKGWKENFYHGILLGLLGHMESWSISSNAETGEGYSDILAEIEEEGIGIVVEVKYAENDRLEAGCRAALEQIEKNRYEEALAEDGMDTIIKYGIACYKKHCKVMLG